MNGARDIPCPGRGIACGGWGRNGRWWLIGPSARTSVTPSLGGNVTNPSKMMRAYRFSIGTIGRLSPGMPWPGSGREKVSFVEQIIDLADDLSSRRRGALVLEQRPAHQRKVAQGAVDGR
jgi:hypothetical protein